jgi:hypothetical protein
MRAFRASWRVVVCAVVIVAAACGGRLEVADCGPEANFCDLSQVCCPLGYVCGSGENGCPMGGCCGTGGTTTPHAHR